MIVYVETNFVVELGYRQANFKVCESIIKLTGTRGVTLAIPAYCLVEPYEKYFRAQSETRALVQGISARVTQVARSQPYRTLITRSKRLTETLVQSVDDQKAGLDASIARIAAGAEVIPLDGDAVTTGMILQAQNRFSPQDSVVYATLLSHMTKRPGEAKCFVTTNSKDFADPVTRQELASYNCKLLLDFAGGLAHIRSQIKPPGRSARP